MISVIIPVYRNAENIPSLLEALQTYTLLFVPGVLVVVYLTLT